MKWYLIKIFLCAAAVALLYSNELDAASKKTKKIKESRSLQKRTKGIYEIRTLEKDLLPKQAHEKITMIRSRIVGNTQMNQQHKQILLEVFDDVAQTQMGRWIFEKAHPDLNFTIKKWVPDIAVFTALDLKQ